MYWWSSGMLSLDSSKERDVNKGCFADVVEFYRRKNGNPSQHHIPPNSLRTPHPGRDGRIGRTTKRRSPRRQQGPTNLSRRGITSHRHASTPTPPTSRSLVPSRPRLLRFMLLSACTAERQKTRVLQYMRRSARSIRSQQLGIRPW